MSLTKLPCFSYLRVVLVSGGVGWGESASIPIVWQIFVGDPPMSRTLHLSWQCTSPILMRGLCGALYREGGAGSKA